MNYPNKYTFIPAVIIVLFSASIAVYAQSTEDSSAQSTDETAQSELQSSGSEIRVLQAGTTTVKEFHQQGKTYKVEIDPKNTPAYILSDQDGNGNLNSSDTSIDNDLVVPQWTIGNW